MSDKKYVTYEEFGAKGDGVTEDFAAIKAAHDYANEHGLPVKAKDGATYYIHDTRIDGIVSEITVRTDTDWGKAEFIIDDSDLSPFNDDKMYTKDIIFVRPDTPTEKIEDEALLASVVKAGLRPGTEKINLGLGKAVMIIPYNTKHKVYRRKGYGGFAGTNMHEVIVLDKDGNVDPDTPVMFEYTNLDYVNVYSLDDKPITIEGGKFTTKACHVDLVYTKADGTKAMNDVYFYRGIEVQRSYTKVKNVQHYITGEITVNEQLSGMLGPAYNGFFGASYANGVTFEGCTLTGRRCYNKAAGGLTGGTMGSYDFRAGRVNKIVLKNCVQSNFFVVFDEDNNVIPATEDTPGMHLSMISIPGTKYQLHWGVGCTDFCKNMEYNGSTLARFDAHMGLYNGKIINSTVNYMAITGGGKMIIENTRWFAAKPDYNANSLIHLREDYASVWDGDITVKNCTAYVYTEDTEGKPIDTWLFMHAYSNWYYGYRSRFPSIEIDNLKYYNIKTKEPLPAGYEIQLCGSSVKGEPALHLPTTLYKHPIFADVDEDGDGFVDGTKIPFDDVISRGGITDESSNVNLNPIIPPEYIRITNNIGVLGGYVFAIPNTASLGVPDGGFLGKTKFSSENEEYVGTDFVGEETKTFRFFNP